MCLARNKILITSAKSPSPDLLTETESSKQSRLSTLASMEATAGTSVTTSLEHDVEDSRYLILSQNLTEVLSEIAEEGYEPNDDHPTSYPDKEDDSTFICDDDALVGKSMREGGIDFDHDSYNGHEEDERADYDETDACEFSYEHAEAVVFEEDDEDYETFNEENEVYQHPMTGFSDISGHEASGNEEYAHASTEAGPKGIEDDWSTPVLETAHLYTYVYDPLFLSSPADIRYAFQRYMINVFEAAFHRFGQNHFGEDLKSDDWRQKTLTDRGVGELANLPWDRVHAVEVKHWIKFIDRVRDAGLWPEDALADPLTFSPPDPSPALVILEMARYMRNKTFHRDEPVIESHLRTAVKIPRVLKDQKRAEELEAIYGIVVNDPRLDAPSSQWVRNILFPQQPEFGTYLEVDTKILSTLEEGCFSFAQREDPELLARRFWTEPEHGEMQIYACNWEMPPSRYHDLAIAMKPEECANLDGQFFLHKHLRKAVMSLATHSRNSVSHRHLLDERDVCYSALNTILCFILMGDRVRAIKVESLVEAFLTKTSQADVLVRLHDASWNDEPARRDAIVEVCRREGIEPDTLDSTKGKSFPVSPRPKSDTGSRWPEISKSAKSKWSLDNDEKMELWHSAVHRFVFVDSMHEMLMRERPGE